MSHPHDLADILIRIVASVAWTFIGVLIFYLGVRFYDRLDPIDYKAEIEKGNLAAAIKLGAVVLGIAAIAIAAIVT